MLNNPSTVDVCDMLLFGTFACLGDNSSSELGALRGEPQADGGMVWSSDDRFELRMSGGTHVTSFLSKIMRSKMTRKLSRRGESASPGERPWYPCSKFTIILLLRVLVCIFYCDRCYYSILDPKLFLCSFSHRYLKQATLLSCLSVSAAAVRSSMSRWVLLTSMRAFTEALVQHSLCERVQLFIVNKDRLALFGYKNACTCTVSFTDTLDEQEETWYFCQPSQVLWSVFDCWHLFSVSWVSQRFLCTLNLQL